MRKIRIISINYLIDLPEAEVINSSMDGIHSFLDADVLIIEPGRLDSLWSKGTTKHGDGTERLSLHNGAERVRTLFARRKEEVKALIQNGKLVLVFMSDIRDVWGEVRFGDPRHEKITNYDWLPDETHSLLRDIRKGYGTEISLTDLSHPLAPYYYAFKSELEFGAYVGNRESSPARIFMANKAGNPVALSFAIGRGILAFLPYVREGKEPKKLIGVLVECAKALLKNEEQAPPPAWITDYALPYEQELLREIDEIRSRIAKEEENLTRVQHEWTTLTEWRRLVYEKGPLLEEAVIRAFLLLGFEAERVKKGDFEHDVLLRSPEGIAVAEVEGRDADAIHIEKLDHLSRVVDETFHDMNDYPQGILVGNPYRLFQPNERPDPFTEKVRKAAQRKQFNLLTTVELFKLVTKLLANPNDEALRACCRRALLQSSGTEIHFPIWE